MASWGLLDGDEENELHKSRLLNVEEKPFKRVTKRLVTLNSLLVSRARQAPTPPPESNGTPAEQDANSPTGPGSAFSADLAQLKEDITLDFAAFDSSIARLQFLLTANERERDRYATERERIVAKSQSVRDNTSQLRLQLDQARATLEQRKKFDVLADKITSNPALRPRVEQEANLKKLEEEIADLEAESKTYGVTWHERRDQFAKIMDESMRLRRLIRDEKEEVERREGMDEGEGENEGHTPRPGLASGNATPRPESGLLPKSGTESGEAVGTPRPLSTAGGRTPARDSPAPGQDGQSFLKPHHSHRGSFSRSGSQIPSREATPDRDDKTDRDEGAEGGDIEMAEAKEDVEAEAVIADDESEPDSPLTPPPADDPPQILIDRQGDEMDTT
ncbi:Tho complex subunit 7-domain-containing protein [Podospora aff. communis PSN243]|uniref:Tho complex subunit 7-domain-containing protein n=1 Tax=Podospora aff. communis PSN243 TaxID=3040156 RepID=A0AAV9G8Y1_9PEZI|nr:Tho complex subunit 7-domain-containing protein [Podospora aff. communis PSN243]